MLVTVSVSFTFDVLLLVYYLFSKSFLLSILCWRWFWL